MTCSDGIVEIDWKNFEKDQRLLLLKWQIPVSSTLVPVQIFLLDATLIKLDNVRVLA